MKCRYCGDDIKTSVVLEIHEKHCPLNPKSRKCFNCVSYDKLKFYCKRVDGIKDAGDVCELHIDTRINNNQEEKTNV